MWGCHGEWTSFGGVTSSPGRRASWDPSPLLLEAVLVLGCCAQPGLCLGSLKLLISSADSDLPCLESNYLFLSLFSLSLSHYATLQGLTGLHWHRGAEMVQWLPSPWQHAWARWGLPLNSRSPHPSPKRRAGVWWSLWGECSSFKLQFLSQADTWCPGCCEPG